MNSFVKKIKRICFIGKLNCNQGGNSPVEEIINGVVNNGVIVSNNGIIVVNNGN